MSGLVIKAATTADDLFDVYRFRYQVYVSEMGRSPAYADPISKTLRHPLDETAINLVAYSGSTIVGAIRNNLGADGPFGCFLEFYGIAAVGTDHPAATSITSGLMVASAQRQGIVGARLSIASYEYGLSRGVRWNFIDCIPPLVGFFKKLGWVQHLPEAKHPEYPFSVARMRLDLEDLDHLARVDSPFLNSWRKQRPDGIFAPAKAPTCS